MIASLKRLSKAIKKSKEKVRSEISNKMKIGRVKLAKAKKLKKLIKAKNFIKFKFKKIMLLSKVVFKAKFFLILEARLVFIQLKKAFTNTPIFHYFDLKYYIYIEINISGYTIGGVLS